MEGVGMDGETRRRAARLKVKRRGGLSETRGGTDELTKISITEAIETMVKAGDEHHS
jgi:hypothetical protein